MELLLSKLLSLWLYPLGLAIAVLVLVTLAQWLLGRWKSGLVLLLVTAGLWLSSTPQVAEWLTGTLERDYPEQAMSDVPVVGAIVVLGGALSPPSSPGRHPNLSDAADRVLHAWRLYRAGKAPQVVISGGQLPWGGAPRVEAEVIADLLVDWGVPREAILTETSSRNTYENVIFTRGCLEEQGSGQVLLVASAFHMRRALAVFQRAGIDAVPAATDHYATSGATPTLLDWMPDAESLYRTTLAFKEYLGMAWYRHKGWM